MALEFERHDFDDGRRDVSNSLAPTERARPTNRRIGDATTIVRRPKLLFILLLSLTISSDRDTGIMASSNWRGTVGIVRPTTRPGGFDDLIRMLPAGIGVIPLCLSIQRGTPDELKTALQQYEDKVAELAQIGVDVINPSGAPPFMVLGYDGEKNLISKWKEKYKVPIFTSGTSHVDALRALKVKRFVGTSYFRGDLNKTYAKYFADAGLDALDMVGMDVDFEKVPELTSQQVYDFVRGVFLTNRRAEAIYMLGPAWRALDIIEKLERNLDVPVVHAVPAQCWDIQRHLHVRIPVTGFGRLAAEMP